MLLNGLRWALAAFFVFFTGATAIDIDTTNEGNTLTLPRLTSMTNYALLQQLLLKPPLLLPRQTWCRSTPVTNMARFQVNCLEHGGKVVLCLML